MICGDSGLIYTMKLLILLNTDCLQMNTKTHNTIIYDTYQQYLFALTDPNKNKQTPTRKQGNALSPLKSTQHKFSYHVISLRMFLDKVGRGLKMTIGKICYQKVSVI